MKTQLFFIRQQPYINLSKKISFLNRIIALLFAILLYLPAFSQTQPAFNCPTDGIILGNGSLYTFNMVTGVWTLVNAVTGNPNGVGYNVKDGYVWGTYTPGVLARIGSDGSIQTFSVPGSLGGQIGDISKDGIYYTSTNSNSMLHVINLDPTSPSYLSLTPLTITGSIPTGLVGGGDLAISPIDGNIYTVGADKQLFRINPTTGVSTLLGTVAALTLGQTYSSFMDDAGNYYVLDGDGKVFRIASPHTGGITATLFSTGTPTSYGDGARCTNAILGPSAINDAISTTCSAANIVITSNDSPGSTPIIMASTRLINPATNLPATTVTITGQGTYVLNPATGNVQFTPVKGFQSTTSVNYVITDQNGLSDQGTITITVNCPLPVTLMSFTANKENTTALLAWATTSETNSDRFGIERSADGKAWNEIGSVKSHSESSVMRNYTYTDENPLKGENLYRLKMIDQDATFAYSRIRSVLLDTGLTQYVYPNPVRKTLYVKDLNKIKSVIITNISGRTVYQSTQLSEIQNGLDIQTLSQGIFVVKLTHADGSVSTQTILINK